MNVKLKCRFYTLKFATALILFKGNYNLCISYWDYISLLQLLLLYYSTLCMFYYKLAIHTLGAQSFQDLVFIIAWYFIKVLFSEKFLYSNFLFHLLNYFILSLLLYEIVYLHFWLWAKNITLIISPSIRFSDQL